MHQSYSKLTLMTSPNFSQAPSRQLLFFGNKEYKKNDKLTIGVSSRFVSRKKIDWVIDALHELKMDGMNVDLKIFGFGKLEKYLRKLSQVIDKRDMH